MHRSKALTLYLVLFDTEVFGTTDFNKKGPTTAVKPHIETGSISNIYLAALELFRDQHSHELGYPKYVLTSKLSAEKSRKGISEFRRGAQDLHC